MSPSNLLGAAIMIIVFGLIFAATVKINGFRPVLLIWATAVVLTSLMVLGVYLLQLK